MEVSAAAFEGVSTSTPQRLVALLSNPKMPGPLLGPHYNVYIAVINAHSSLAPFVYEHVTPNDDSRGI